MENKQNLGIKVFYYYLSKNILAGIFLLIISIAVASFKTIIIKGLIYIVPSQAASELTNILIIGLFIITFFILVINIVLSWLKYKSCYFIVGENTFTVKTGLFNKIENSIPYQQIQNMNIEQSFSYRMMGICELHILTAGNDNNDKEGEAGVNLKVIDMNVAKKLREVVLQKTNIKNI